MDKQQYAIYHEKKAHSSADFSYNTYLCSIPLDFSFVPSHWHEDMELIVIKKGNGTVTVDLNSFEVSTGDIIFVLPGQVHSIEQKSGYSMEYENIIFKPSLLKAVNQDLCYKNYLEPFFNGKIDFSCYITPDQSDYTQINYCIEQIDLLCSHRLDGYQLAVKGLLFTLFFLLISKHPPKVFSSKEQKNLDKIKLILSYIQENYSHTITVKAAADICHYSESHFMKFFKDCIGISFTQYLNDYRLRIAAQTLREKDDNILDIAASTGFENLSYFNRAFKRKYLVSPGQYRKLSRT